MHRGSVWASSRSPIITQHFREYAFCVVLRPPSCVQLGEWSSDCRPSQRFFFPTNKHGVVPCPSQPLPSAPAPLTCFPCFYQSICVHLSAGAVGQVGSLKPTGNVLAVLSPHTPLVAPLLHIPPPTACPVFFAYVFTHGVHEAGRASIILSAPM